MIEDVTFVDWDGVCFSIICLCVYYDETKYLSDWSNIMLYNSNYIIYLHRFWFQNMTIAPVFNDNEHLTKNHSF